MSHLLSQLVGCQITFTPEHGDTHTGVVTKATYSTGGEPVVTVRPIDDPLDLTASVILLGRDAAAVVEILQSNVAGNSPRGAA